jgi:hypothetical protein
MDLLPPPGSGSAAEADFNEAIASKQLQYSLEYCPLSVDPTQHVSVAKWRQRFSFARVQPAAMQQADTILSSLAFAVTCPGLGVVYPRARNEACYHAVPALMLVFIFQVSCCPVWQRFGSLTPSRISINICNISRMLWLSAMVRSLLHAFYSSC